MPPSRSPARTSIAMVSGSKARESTPPDGGAPRGSVRHMDFELSDEQQLIRRTAREFSDREIAPRATENARNKHFDLDLVRRIADQGYLGAIVPREYGGAGLDYLTYGLVTEEVGRNDSA